MATQISASVGNGGVNRKDDSMAVQTLLNKVPADQGGPAPQLIVDGLPWKNTIEAIRRFQSMQLNFKWPDGRVDPNGLTLQKLNAISDKTPPSITPPESVDFEIPNVPLYLQHQMGLTKEAATFACWWACIRMVRDTGGVDPSNPPPELVNFTGPLNNWQIENIISRYQMYAPYPSPSPSIWTAAELVAALKQRGPMCAIGRFSVGDTSTSDFNGSDQHSIVVFGVGNNGQTVICNDPLQPITRRLFLGEFNDKLHVGRIRLIASRKHLKDMKTVPGSGKL